MSLLSSFFLGGDAVKDLISLCFCVCVCVCVLVCVVQTVIFIFVPLHLLTVWCEWGTVFNVFTSEENSVDYAIHSATVNMESSLLCTTSKLLLFLITLSKSSKGWP